MADLWKSRVVVWSCGRVARSRREPRPAIASRMGGPRAPVSRLVSFLPGEGRPLSRFVSFWIGASRRAQL
jgi:hypothetical protein